MVDATAKDDPETGSSTKPDSSPSSTESSSGFSSLIQKKYDTFVEAGKRKLGFYHPEVSDSDRYLMGFLIYFTVLLMVVFVADYAAQKTYEDSNSLTPLQELEVKIVFYVQRDVFDMPVTVNWSSNTIWYDTSATWHGQNLTKDESIGGFGLEIASACSGFHEMVFLSVLVLGFRGVPVKLRAKWTFILVGIVFIENLFRIFALYPLALYKGRDFEEWFHFYWWHYGQYAFIMGLFGLWFFFVARKHIGVENDESAKKKEKKTEPSVKDDDSNDPKEDLDPDSVDTEDETKGPDPPNKEIDDELNSSPTDPPEIESGDENAKDPTDTPIGDENANDQPYESLGDKGGDDPIDPQEKGSEDDPVNTDLTNPEEKPL